MSVGTGQQDTTYLTRSYINPNFEVKLTSEVTFQACAAMRMRSVLFWDFTQRRMVFPFRRFGTSHWSRLQGGLSIAGPLKSQKSVNLQGLEPVSAIQEIFQIVWNPKVHSRIQKKPLRVPSLNQMNPFHAVLSSSFKIKFNILPSTSVSSKSSFPSQVFQTQLCMYVFLFSFVRTACSFLEDGTDRLSRNVGKKLPLLAA